MELSTAWATDTVLTDDSKVKKELNLDFTLVCFVSKHDFYSEKGRKKC